MASSGEAPDPGDERRDLLATGRRVLTWALALALLASVAGVVWIATHPPETTPPYTEFYLLGPGGNASGYPTNLTTGASGTVIVGVTNHEHTRERYRLQVRWNDTTAHDRLLVAVDDGETREVTLTLTAPAEPGRYRVRFLLYLGEEVTAEPYRALRLWVTVRPPPSEAAAVEPRLGPARITAH